MADAEELRDEDPATEPDAASPAEAGPPDPDADPADADSAGAPDVSHARRKTPLGSPRIPASLDPLSRPLPSVDMALLPGQVRAARTRRMAAGVGLTVLALGGLVFLVVGWLTDDAGAEPVAELPPVGLPAEDEGYTVDDVIAPDDPEPEPEPEPVVAAPEPEETESGRQRFTATFGQARGFRPALLAAGLSNEESAAIEGASEGVLDFRRCRPDHELVYERDAEGRLVRFEYHDQPTSYAVYRRNAESGAMEGERVEREVERIRIARGGTVRSSLGDAVEAVGLGRTLVGLFVEVFDGKVNFSTQARAGDQFRVILDEERLEGEFLRWGQVHALEYVGQRAGTLRAFHFVAATRGEWYDEEGRQIRGSWMRVPCRYDRMSSPFNPRRMHPILRRIVPHNGVDFAASTGTPVWAAADGVITWAGPKGPNGNLVSIRHEGGYESHYAHLHRIQRGIRPGVEVEQRQLIGAVGTTGRSTGPHLHFGLKRHNRFVDPMAVLNGPGRMLPAGPLGRYRRTMRELRAELSDIEIAGPAPVPSSDEEEDEEPADEALD